MATLRGWHHCDNVAIQEIITALADEMPERVADIGRGLAAVERLHGNFYEVYMTPLLAEFALSEARPLLQILWALLPDQYTAGASFEQWLEPEQGE